MAEDSRKIGSRVAFFVVYVVIVSMIEFVGEVGSQVCGDGEICINATSRDLNDSSIVPENYTHPDDEFNYLSVCPSNVECSKLAGDCIKCNLSSSCQYGTNVSDVYCQPRPEIVCTGPSNFTKTVQCKYGYQLELWEYTCDRDQATQCKVVTAPRDRYQSMCTVKANVLCLGRRRFFKMHPCNWTAGYRWSTALLLSVTLGGLGVDRFYLGLWRAGLGKLFSFGGLGVWTIVDVILIATGYVGPEDGSVYIY